MVKYTARGLVVKRPGVLSKVGVRKDPEGKNAKGKNF